MKAIIALVVVAMAATASAAPSPLYDRYCLACHGERGDGKGPAAPWLAPRPRDFTRGVYKWRSTASGRPPLHADLARVIREGAPGTAMPAFAGILSDAQIDALAGELMAMAPARFAGPPPAAVAIPPRPAAVSDGASVWERLGCTACHGPGGRGDGPSAAGLDPCPFDLTRAPPRGGDVVRTLLTGVDGTAMPAISAPAADLHALADLVASLRAEKAAPAPVLGAGPAPDPGLHPAPQGPAPPSLPPAAASLSAATCGRCHARQHEAWRGSLHARAVGPGLTGQLHGSSGDGCMPCHAPLAEQRADASLRADGVSCAGCHLDGHTRHGPPRRPDSALLPIASYPFVEDRRYERADLCLPCHQLGPETALAGKPMLDTYREWLLGPYMPRGVQCQHCHMPEREHSWKGIHDRETARQGLRMSARVDGDKLRVTLENAGAGHYLPTTPTPAIFVDAGGARRRIGRNLSFTGGRFVEHEDTRIGPGKSVQLEFPVTDARVVVTVAPDEYYERFYAELLRQPRPPRSDASRRELEAALRQASSSRYVLYDVTASAPAARRP